MTEPITTELRTAMVEFNGEPAMRLDVFNRCVDAIDAVHANLERENESLRRELDRVLGEREDRGGWIELPKDADGEYIRIGDVMEVINSKQRAKVCYMQMGPRGTWAVGLTKNCHWYDIESLRHHHAPTVEDVLREFAVEVCGEPALTIRSGVVEEYASRLRLAGES